MKNKTSNRTLPLIPHIEEMLINEKERQRKNKELCGDAYDNRYLDYVCVNDIGTLYYPDYLSQHFRVIQKQNNLKLIRFHDLRHSCASLMLANGVQMKQIQEWLGHSTYNTTADIYAHLDYSSKIASANVISGVLDFENNSNLSDKEVLENEIAELEKQLKEKKKLRKTKDFEM